jgi:hypothetical protein
MIESGRPETKMSVGDVVVLTMYNGRQYRLRIEFENPTAGMLTLTMVAENG